MRHLKNILYVVLIVISVVLIVISVIFAGASLGYLSSHDDVPQSEEPMIETTPLKIDLPEKEKPCNLTVYDANDEVLFSCTGDATVGAKKEDGTIDIFIKTQNTGNR